MITAHLKDPGGATKDIISLVDFLVTIRLSLLTECSVRVAVGGSSDT